MWTKARINRLGDRLRRAEEIDAELLTDLQNFRFQYYAPMLEVQQRIVDTLGLDATARLKTVNTIIEKLKRERTRLSTMQDIAGVRLVIDGDRIDQDRIVDQISGLFPGADIDDRRVRPNRGYRAVHVIATSHGFPVEAQVRTRAQDLWAQTVERLADAFGRELRYGGVVPGTEQILALLAQVSQNVHLAEELTVLFRTSMSEAEEELADPQLATQARLQRLARIDELKVGADEVAGILGDLSVQLRAMLSKITHGE